MTPAEMRSVARALDEVSEAVRGIEDVSKRVKLLRAIGRAAGDLAEQAVQAFCTAVGRADFMLDDWGQEVGLTKMASSLRTAALRLRWRADVEERPDDLRDILADRMERGMVYLPKDLLKELYLVGLAVKEVVGGKKVGDDLERLSMGLLMAAADWSTRVDEARDSERDVLTRVEPF